MPSGRKSHMTIRDCVVKDCIDLLPFAEDSAKVLASRNVKKLKSLYTGQSQRIVVEKLTRLVDDLGRCRTTDDLPGPVEEVKELRNVSLDVFRGLTEYAGNPFGLTACFRNEAVEFFRGLLARDPALLARVRKRRERTLAVTLLTCAITLMGMILYGMNIPAAMLSVTSGLFRGIKSSPRKRTTHPARHVEDGEAMQAERREVLAWANDAKRNPSHKLPHELALAVWRAHEAAYAKAAKAEPSKRGYKDAKSLRARFYPNKSLFINQRRKGIPYSEP